MDKNSNAKQSTKKSSNSVDKSKKSASKKKKKNKKPLSAKSDQSPDQLEIEGVRALDQNELESDSSSTRQNVRTPQQRSSIASDVDTDVIRSRIQPIDASDRSKDGSNILKPVRSSNSITNDVGSLKRPSVTFSNFDEPIPPSNSSSSMAVKQKNSSKSGKTKSGNTKGSSNGAKGSQTSKSEPSKSSSLTKNNAALANAAKLKSLESLRWENQLEDEEKEEERLHIYKMNRRKRYLAAAQAKGLGWVVDYGSNGSPVSEDSGLDNDLPEREAQQRTVNDYTVQAIIPSHNGTPVSLPGELAC